MDQRAETIAVEAYEAGVKQAYADAGYDPSYYEAPKPEYTMNARPSRARGAQRISSPGPSAARPPEAAGSPEVPEVPGMQDLINSVSLQDFADMPDDYMIQDPEMAQQLMQTGQNYVNQLRQFYSYLVQQGMGAAEAAKTARSMVSRDFSRFSTSR